MKKFNIFWQRLSNRIISLFLLLSILPLIVVSIFAYDTGRSSLEAAVLNRLKTINLLKINEYSHWIESNQKQIRILSQDERVKFYVTSLLNSNINDGEKYQAIRGYIVNEYLQPQVSESLGFIKLSIIDATNGKILVSTDADLEGKYREKFDFFKEGLKDTYVQKPIYLLPDEERVMFISTPIKDDGNKIIAVLAGRVDLDEMMSIISARSGNSETEETYLINESNLFITDSRFLEDAALRKSVFTQGVNECLKGISGYGYYDSYREIPVVGVYDWLDKWKICIITEESQSEAFQSTAKLSRTILVVGLLAIVISLGVGFAITQSITNPIKTLIQGADKIGQRELGYHIKVGGGTELNHLAIAFNNMSDSLNKADKENQKLVEELKSWSKELEKRVDERTIELKESNALSDSIINSMPGIFYLFDIHGKFVRWNDIFEHVTGYAEDEIVHLHPTDLFPENERKLIFDMIQDAIQIGDTSVDANILSKSGELTPYFLTGMRIELNGQQFIIGTGVETTQLKMAEAALLKINQDLSRSNEELERFAYIASHDLQEPLRMVSSYLQLLERRYKETLDDDAKEFIGFAVDGASRMKQLINDLLTFSRVGTRGKELAPVSSQEVFDVVLKDFDLLIRETDAVIKHDPLPMVMADASQLKQVFQNIIGNALKFKGDKKPEISVRVKRYDHIIEYSISDNGIGINPQFFDRIFIIFQRLHNSEEYQGTGIGLALCKKIIQRHGGEIWVKSEPGKGSAFYFTLPAVEKNGENHE